MINTPISTSQKQPPRGPGVAYYDPYTKSIQFACSRHAQRRRNTGMGAGKRSSSSGGSSTADSTANTSDGAGNNNGDNDNNGSPSPIPRVLEASIIEMSSTSQSSSSAIPFAGGAHKMGKQLMGEVLEIVIMDEGMSTLVVHTDKNKKNIKSESKQKAKVKAAQALAGAEKNLPDQAKDVKQQPKVGFQEDVKPQPTPSNQSSSSSSNTKEELLQQQRNQQSLHYTQSNELLSRHIREKNEFEIKVQAEEQSDENFERNKILWREMEKRHDDESKELQTRQQNEQEELIHLIFQCASRSSNDTSASVAGESVDIEEEKVNVQSNVVTSTTSVSTFAPLAGQISQQQQNQHQPIQPQRVQPQVQMSKPQPLQQQPVQPPMQESFQSITQANKQDEIKAVMRDRSLGREERQARLAEIRQRYAAVDDVSSSTSIPQPQPIQQPLPVLEAQAGVVSSTTPVASSVDKSMIDELRREEIQAVMKDKSLGREEKQKKLADIKARYASVAGAIASVPPEAAPAHTSNANRWNRAAVAAVTFGRVNDQLSHAQDHLKIQQQQEEEERLRRQQQQEQHQKRVGLWNKAAVASVTARAMNTAPAASALAPSPSPPPQIPAPSTTSVASRWNRAAVASVTARAMNATPAAAPAPPQTPAPSATSAASRWNRAAVASVTARAMNTAPIIPPSSQNSHDSGDSHTLDQEINQEPMSLITRSLERNDPDLVTLRLDGRKSIFSSDDWESFFDSLEDNTHLTHLSLVNCGLDDETCVPLALALVENETLIYLNLSYNRGLGEDTGKSILKVLKQSNQVLKEVYLDGTKVSSKTLRKLKSVLEERDESVQFAKLQEERSKKIKELLSFTASDEVSNQLPKTEVEPPAEDVSVAGKSMKSQSKKSDKSVRSVGSDTSSKKKHDMLHRRDSMSSMVSTGSKSTTHKQFKKAAVLAVATSAPRKKPDRGAERARQMASMGGDVVTDQMREQRKIRGECESCGQKCFEKRMFKTTPLTIPQKVHEGRCLVCNPI